MKKTLMLASIVATFAVSVSAAASNNEVYAGVGTTGLTAGYARAINDHGGARIELNVLNVHGQLNDPDVDYEARLKMNTVGVYYDFFPFQSSSLRITGGAIFGNKKVDLAARANSGTVTVNGRDYNANGESLFGSVKQPSATPYIGIGTGHKASSSGLSISTDFGVSYGRPTVSLSASPALLAAAGQDNVDAERNKVQDKVSKYALYPVIRIAIGYAF